MKKLMIAASAALVATVGLCVESANIVGYTTKTSGESCNFLTIPFDSVGNNTADIQTIKLSDGGAASIGWGTETFAVWEGAPSIVEGSSFIYCDPSLDPSAEATDYYWGDGDGNKVNFSIAEGQGIVVECAADLTISTAGQVPTTAVPVTTIEGCNFTGNPFPTAIDIQSFSLDDGGAASIGWGTETFAVWEGAPSIVEGSSFIYCDPSLDPSAEATGYYWGDGDGNKATYSIPANQGVVIECAAGLSMTIAAPYSL